MSAPVTVIVVTADTLFEASQEIEETGMVEFYDQGGNVIRLELPEEDPNRLA